MTVEEAILERIRPAEADVARAEATVHRLVGRLEEAIHAITDLDVSPKLVGSIAKGTYLRDPDIDVFIMFPQEIDGDEMKDLGLRIGKEVVDGEERYAEHPYVHGEFEGFEVDLVPCFRIEDTSAMRTSVDRTPFHTDFVLAHMGAGQRDEVRLLKAFMKGIGTYGAEARVEGFSGYLNELLVLRYGGFRKVLEAATGWRRRLVLSLEERGEGIFDDPLTFYDPVDPGRNVASALSLDAMARFVAAAKDYLEEEDERFFFPSPLETWEEGRIREEFALRGSGLTVVRLERPDIIDDNLYPQVRRSLDGVCDLLGSKGFIVTERSCHVAAEVLLAVEVENPVLPAMRRHDGPPVWVSNAKSFLRKWADASPFIDDGRWHVYVSRGERTVPEAIVANTGAISWGSRFRGAPGMEIVDIDGALRRGWGAALTAHLDRRMPWRR